MAPENLDTLRLQRWPRLRGERLLAYDGADRYLLKILEQERVGADTLVINDQCGALWLGARALGEGPVYSAGDDWVAWRAAVANGEDNGVTMAPETWLWPGQVPPSAPDQVLLRLPKSRSLLETQLSWLAGWLPAGTPVWVAGMDKHLPPGLVDVIAGWLGEASAGLGWKKARVFRARAPGGPIKPAPKDGEVTLEDRGWQLRAGPGVFGRRRLDIGARFLLEHLPGPDAPVTGEVADLGCGNGVLGLSLAADHPAARVTFCDVSWLAVESARDNVHRHLPAPERHEFHHGNGLDGLDRRFDLILLNPPFHRGHALDDQVARMLFRHARRHLVPGGELRVVANRHLQYTAALRKGFARVETVAGNGKFQIYRCLAS